MAKASGIGYVKLHRSFRKWGWYNDVPCRLLMLHLFLEVNRLPGEFMGVTIQPGQLATSLPKLAADVGISIQQARTSLSKLKTTGEITDQATGQFRVVTLVKWVEYQGDGGASTWEATGSATGDQQADNRRRLGPATPIQEERIKKKETTPSGVVPRGASIADRREAFVAACRAVIEANPERLPKSERKAFTDYWTEPSASGKMRFEAEKFFDHGRRMDNWHRRNATPSNTPHNPRA